MPVHTGNDRVAFVGDKFTVKVARSHPKLFGTSLKQTIEKHGVKYAIDFWEKFSTDNNGSFQRMLFHGIVANRRESRLAAQYGRIVIPTVSVLGGIANIQPTSQPVDLDFDDIWKSFVGNLGPKATALGHMMEDVNNFGVYENRVMFVDGGSQGLEQLVPTRSKEIERSLGSVGVMLGLPEA